MLKKNKKPIRRLRAQMFLEMKKLGYKLEDIAFVFNMKSRQSVSYAIKSLERGGDEIENWPEIQKKSLNIPLK